MGLTGWAGEGSDPPTQKALLCSLFNTCLKKKMEENDGVLPLVSIID